MLEMHRLSSRTLEMLQGRPLDAAHVSDETHVCPALSRALSSFGGRGKVTPRHPAALMLLEVSFSSMFTHLSLFTLLLDREIGRILVGMERGN